MKKIAMLTVLACFATGCAWFTPLGSWTVQSRHYESECVDVLKQQSYPGEATALVHPRVIRLGECAVPLTDDGRLESTTMCWGPGGDQMALRKGKFNKYARTLEMSGTLFKYREADEEAKSCPVKFTVQFKPEVYVALDPLAPVTHAKKLRAQTPR